MAEYLLIETRDPFESRAVEADLELAGGLAARGDRVALFLVQNGVIPARAGARTDLLAALPPEVEVLADDFSLRERGIGAGELADRVSRASLEVVVDRLAAGTRTIWL